MRVSGRNFLTGFRGGRAAAFDFLRTCASGAMPSRWAAWKPGLPSESTTHSGMSAQELDEAGIGDGLVRVSVGIEDWRDLLADFEQALERVK